MDNDDLLKSLEEYKKQLKQVELALSRTEEGEDKSNLLTLQSDIKQLIELTEESLPKLCNSNTVDDEYALFMTEMAKEGVIETKPPDINNELQSLEGMKCRAPHEHTWGDIAYHNALISSVISPKNTAFDNIEVKVMFINPTHREMLTCPYLLESDCKFSEEKCRFSHGKIVPFSKLEEYLEPNYEDLQVGSFVLVKSTDNLWHRGTVKRLFKENCCIQLEASKKDVEVEFCDVLPMENEKLVESESDEEHRNHEDIINMSLLITPSSEKLGDWEKFTKGVGSKLMEKMGYVVGTGLGKYASGRIDPVSAVVLPPGKSLDHCMELREKAGGDKNLFSVERKLKRQQRKQELRNQKNYERENKKVDVFNFLNKTLLKNKSDVPAPLSKSDHRKEIKSETCRNLNVESLKIDESIRDVQKDMFKIKESLTRHQDVNSQVHKQLTLKLNMKQEELLSLKSKALNIKNEQAIRSDKKKLTIF